MTILRQALPKVNHLSYMQIPSIFSCSKLHVLRILLNYYEKNTFQSRKHLNDAAEQFDKNIHLSIFIDVSILAHSRKSPENSN